MPEDINQFAYRIVAESTAEATPQKNPHAVALGRLGGKKGGPARAKKLSAARRRAIARKGGKSHRKHAEKKSLP